MKYARAAAAVRACAVKLEVTREGRLSCALPYVGGALEAQIVDLLRTGTCTQLEQFKCAAANSNTLTDTCGSCTWRSS